LGKGLSREGGRPGEKLLAFGVGEGGHWTDSVRNQSHPPLGKRGDQSHCQQEREKKGEGKKMRGGSHKGEGPEKARGAGFGKRQQTKGWYEAGKGGGKSLG